ncbi:3-keto-5-aminohexanoate cleavage protein [Burkholderia pyrrocinia]|uniref:3-keto-5-aminohexanoate cleavage protein n=1 Tax=Burkholderia pyrrocinia TaxID=60550 RepID=UPI0030CACCBE
MKLVSYLLEDRVEIGALANAERDVIRLQAAQVSASGQPAAHFNDMLAFLAGDEAARDAASGAVEFAQSQRPPGVVVPLGSVSLLSPVPRPESIREFMNFEQHVINCARRFGMKPWRAKLDNFIERRFGREHTLAFKANRPWYERPIYYKGNRFTVIGHDTPVVMQSALLGGHVRVGMEDNAFIFKGVFAQSNAQQVKKARDLVKELGPSIASPAQARQILGLKAR